MTPVVAMVLRSGGDFKPEHVIRLWAQLRDRGQWAGHVVCLTDVLSGWPPADIELLPLTREWPGWWSKLELCAPEHYRLGDMLFMDLDTTVVGPIADLANVGCLTLLSDFYRSGLYASGVMYLPTAPRRNAWELLHAGAGAQLVIRSFRRKGDQGFFNLAWHGLADRWQDILPGQIVSFKEHVQPAGFSIPEGARLVCYHGKPRPWEVDC